MTYPSPPRVALVAHAVHDRGGMERVCYELVRRAGGRVRFVVVSQDLASELRPLVEWKRVHVPRRPIPAKFTAFFALAGLELARTRVDLVHTVGALVPNRADIAAVHFCHAGWYRATGTLAPRDAPVARRVNTSIQRTLAIAAERWCYRPGRVRTLAAVSHRVAAEVERHYPGVRVVVTPNGVDTDRFRPDAGARRALRCAEGLRGGDVVALFVGGDWDRKGLAVAIEGLARTNGGEGGPVRLWVVGRGDITRFEGIAARAGVADRVRFFGQQVDPAPFYQAADLLLAPSDYEPFSLAMLEGAAAGLPLIATDVGVARPIVGPGDGGVIVEREPSSIGAAVARVVADAATRARMSATARQRAAAFSWDASVENVLAEYERLLRPGASNGRARSS